MVAKNTSILCAAVKKLSIVLVLIVAGGMHSQTATPNPTLPSMTDTTARDLAGLHNVVLFHEGFYSGSAPEGDEGFNTLASIGIKTIISVDGAIPENDQAKKRGMRYVHLPIGYDGFDAARKAEMARAVRDLPKPMYMHCHHGKHRSAGAAATIAVSLGWMTNDAAAARMKVSGTAPGYKGLWACTAAAGVMTSLVIDAARADFPAITKPNSFVGAMVEIDEAFDRLKLAEKSGWTAPIEHPDLAPISDAGKLADLFRLIGDPTDTSKRDADANKEVRTWLANEATTAAELEKMIARADALRTRGGKDAGEMATQRARMSQMLSTLGASCKQCHVKYRD